MKTGKSQWITAHGRALEKPATREILGRLHRYWKRWDSVKRGEQLKKLLNAGCTLRGLAKDFGNTSPASLKNYVTLASLSQDERYALRQGQTQKRTLARKTAADHKKKALSRLEVERSTGRPSDELADIIMDFFRTVEAFRPLQFFPPMSQIF